MYPCRCEVNIGARGRVPLHRLRHLDLATCNSRRAASRRRCFPVRWSVSQTSSPCEVASTAQLVGGKRSQTHVWALTSPIFVHLVNACRAAQAVEAPVFGLTDGRPIPPGPGRRLVPPHQPVSSRGPRSLSRRGSRLGANHAVHPRRVSASAFSLRPRTARPPCIGDGRPHTREEWTVSRSGR